jgi:predicted transcriptional regulator
MPFGLSHSNQALSMDFDRLRYSRLLDLTEIIKESDDGERIPRDEGSPRGERMISIVSLG